MKNLTRWAALFVLPIMALLLLGGQSAQAATTTLHHLSLPLGIMGATIGTGVATLSDVAKRLDPDGTVPRIVEMLNQTNAVLDDMLWREGNLPTGHRTTVRTGLPTVAWRLLNQGVATSKSTTAQIDEQCGLLEAWSEVDVDLAALNGNAGAFRLSEAQAFIEAMNQSMVSTLFYGNSGVTPEQFTGLAVRYSDATNALNRQNIVKATASPSGNDQTSIWLVVWGENTITGIYPKGSQAGLSHKDLGEETAETTAGLGGTRMRVYRDQWQWKCGIALKDWRYVVRIANVDISALIANAGAQADLFQAMIKATYRIPNLSMGTPVFYMNRTVAEYLDIQARTNVTNGGQLTYNDVAGRKILTFRGIPCRIVDQLTEAEAIVS